MDYAEFGQAISEWAMSDPHSADSMRTLEPVHADEPEVVDTRWTGRLMLFLRVMAVLSMIKGLYHWAVVCGMSGDRKSTRLNSSHT